MNLKSKFISQNFPSEGYLVSLKYFPQFQLSLIVDDLKAGTAKGQALKKLTQIKSDCENDVVSGECIRPSWIANEKHMVLSNVKMPNVTVLIMCTALIMQTRVSLHTMLIYTNKFRPLS